MVGKIIGAAIYPHPPAVINEIGGKRVEEIQKTKDGVHRLSKMIGQKKPDTIVVITPHGALFQDLISIDYNEELIGDFSMFNNYDLSYEYKNDRELIDAIVDKADENKIATMKLNNQNVKDFSESNRLDHGTLVPIHFIEKYYDEFEMVTMTYGLLSPEKLYDFGKVIKEAVEKSGKRVLIIASGDLSHKLKDGGPYEYHPAGKKFDEKMVSLIENWNPEGIVNLDEELREKAGECGSRSFQIMAGTLDGKEVKTEVFSYEGPLGVGYMTAYLDIIRDEE